MIKINTIPDSQSQWFNISFKSIGYKRKLLKLPNHDFYFLFFKEFKKKFKSIDQLPKKWIQEKHETAILLSKNIQKGNILSYQSGLSFIENDLNKLINKKIFIHEFTDMSKVFFSNPNLIFLKKESLKNYNFNNVILCQMLYDKNYFEIKKIITELKDIMFNSSYLYIIHSDLRDNKFNILVQILKFIIKHFFNPYEFFWGYRRSLNYYSRLLHNEGFILKRVIKLDHQSLMIFKKN